MISLGVPLLKYSTWTQADEMTMTCKNSGSEKDDRVVKIVTK